MQSPAAEPRGITAILGPTNTGKTHQALARMLEHRTGMIGLPLRLLAREVYDRLTTQVGEADVALITGEEKRIPKRPRYLVCTVEAMPVSHSVDFLAVDEIQLCSHNQRGHVFTDRLLNARGTLETWFLGSETIRDLIQRFAPTARIVSRPRLSTLRAAPTKTLSHLPPRTAVVAFSVERVYELATQLKNKRGGTAIVLGALSPRTRNAQVALYQSGEVDYMVATDAIGMGLNLDIDHVAFADYRKFDGQLERPLSTAELAQIAGRAGRYLNSGTFGTLSPLREFSPQIIRAIESHSFPPESQLFWRSTELNFNSVTQLLQSLRALPQSRGLRLMEAADDLKALAALAQIPAVQERLTSPERLQLLWVICQIPDFRQLWFELHLKLLEELFLQLSGDHERIQSAFIDERLKAIDDTRGDIDTLMGRISDIRTWTYVATHRSWVTEADSLRERASAIEDRLSDALHEKLVAKFIEHKRTTSIAPTRVRDDKPTRGSGPFAALLRHYVATETPQTEPSPHWAELLVDAAHDQFGVDQRGRVSFQSKNVAQFEAGLDILHPGVRLLNSGQLGPGVRSRMQRRLIAFGQDLIAGLFAPLRGPAANELSPAARGLIYQIETHLGNVPSSEASPQLAALNERDRQLLTSFGVHLGHRIVYLRRLLHMPNLVIRSALVSAHHVLPFGTEQVRLGAASIPLLEHAAATWWSLLGYVAVRPLAIRVDLFESIDRQLDHLAARRSFPLPETLQNKLACSNDQLDQFLRNSGFTCSAGRYRATRRRPRTAPQNADRA